MAVQMLQSNQFTLTFRGYDKAEVDEYVESLWDRQSETNSALEEAEEAIVSLEARVQTYVQRVADLESCVRDENPRTIAALGERVTLILEQAEDAAAETVVAAQQEADAIRRDAALVAERVTQRATNHVSELEAGAAATVHAANERARQLEHEARRSATQILDDAEAQAQGRISDITQWVSHVRAQIKAEQIQAAEEFYAARDERQAELRAIVARRDGVLDGLRDVCETVTETITTHRAPEHPDAANGDAAENGDPTDTRSGDDPSSLFDPSTAAPPSPEQGGAGMIVTEEDPATGVPSPDADMSPVPLDTTMPIPRVTTDLGGASAVTDPEDASSDGHTAGAHFAGTDSAGTDAVGTDSVGTDPAGTDSAG